MWAEHKAGGPVFITTNQLHISVTLGDGILREFLMYLDMLFLPFGFVYKQVAHIYVTINKRIIKMEGENVTEVSIVGFRKIERPGEVSEKAALWGIQQHLVSLVILEFGCSPEEKKRLKEVQVWARTHSEDVRLSRVPKREAFLQTYKDAARSPIKTYFLTCLSIDQLSNEPLQAYYHQLPPQEASLKELNKLAQLNLQRIGFIILKEKMESLDRRSYFHANVALITSEVKLVQDLLQESIKILVKLRAVDSSSSINSQEAQRFGQELEEVGLQLPVYESEHSQLERHDKEALKLLNNTPGVGTYNIQGHRL